MKNFVLLVNTAPYENRINYSAAKFAQALLDEGFHILQIFFYASGVMNASQLSEVESAELDMKSHWQALYEQGVPLVLCMSAAQKRGVVAHNLNTIFTEGSLSDFAMVSIVADKIVQFGKYR